MTPRNLAFRVVSSLFITLLLAPPPIFAAARVIQERAKVSIPGPTDQRIARIAFSGNTLLALGHRLDETSEGTFRHSVVYMFERASPTAAWVHTRILHESRARVGTLDPVDPVTIALEGNTAVVVFGTVYVFERSGTAWNLTASLGGTTNGLDVEIDAGTIVLGGRYCQWRSYRKNSAGQWRALASYGPIHDCSFISQDVDISGTRIILANPLAGSIGPVFTSAVHVFDGLNTTSPTATINSPFTPDAAFGHVVAVEGNTIVAGDEENAGIRAFVRNSIGWSYEATLQPADAYMLSWPLNVDMQGNLVAIPHPSDSERGTRAGSVEIQRRNSDNSFTEVARLHASDAGFETSLGNDAEIDGRTVAVASRLNVYFFDLPTDLSQPTRIHDNFNSGNAANWTPQAGSNFSVVTAGTSRVYRQSSLVGNAASMRTNLDWRDQSIQADIRPRALDGNDRWVGLVVRYQDANNYYYVTLRSRGILQVKKIVNGVVTSLSAVGAPFQLGRNYRIGVQAIGTRLTFFENGRKITEDIDTSLTHGSAGFMSYKMTADFDNVVVSPSPLRALMDEPFGPFAERWTTLGDGEWNIANPDGSGFNYIYEQSSVAGGARSITGVKTRDQTVQVEARPLAFGAGPGRWFGVIARYVDDNNYYYVTVRNDNSLSLRKLVNGGIVELRTVPFTLTVGQWYQLRLEAIGSSLRVYVGDEMMIEATDSSHTEGRYGLAMYKAHTTYDNFLATQQ